MSTQAMAPTSCPTCGRPWNATSSLSDRLLAAAVNPADWDLPALLVDAAEALRVAEYEVTRIIGYAPQQESRLRSTIQAIREAPAQQGAAERLAGCECGAK